MDGLESHLKACDLFQFPDNMKAISFLTIEDFNTTGLDGTTAEDGKRPPTTELSNFYEFWWCEGASKKTGKEGGRWGLGKTTFHMASQLKSFWGLTVRQDDSRELLMGKALLKSHRIDDIVYPYEGYFKSGEGFSPIIDKDIVQKFKQNFAISRNNESGLSLVIPMPYNEIDSSSIVNYVIIHYAFAIFKGLLEVEIRREGECLNLNAGNLVDIAYSRDWKNTAWENVNVKELLQFLTDSIYNENIISLTVADNEKPEITKDSFGDKIDELKSSFNTGNLLSFKVPVVIKKINGTPSSTYFNIYLKKYPHLKQSEEFFVRSGITISDIKMLGNCPLRMLFLAEDSTISEFLGDAETPAHTHWNERTV
ncbi:hypothetical protein KKA94_00550 [Patescibacteria group bacterium]|nr:hypothetical protein [Patescibacteria group bacterium]